MDIYKIDTLVSYDNDCIRFQGQKVFDFYKIKLLKANERKTLFTDSARVEHVELSNDRVISIRSKSHSSESGVYSTHTILNRIKDSPMPPQLVMKLLKKVYIDRPKVLTTLLTSIVKSASEHYDAVIVDYPGVGGIDISGIYDDNEELIAEYDKSSLVKTNLYSKCMLNCGVNLSKFDGARVLIISACNPHIAADVKSLICSKKVLSIGVLF